MSMTDATKFVERYRMDQQFRTGAYEASTPEEFRRWVRAGGFRFTDDEIDDAFRSLKLRARDEEEALEIEELRAWFFIMAGGLESSALCSGCTTGAGCRQCGH